MPGSPIAVLVQPLIEPRYGGVLFGVDPVTGRTDRRTVSAVDGGPEPLVSGEVDGSRYVLDTKGRVVDFTQGDGPALPTAVLRRLVALSKDVERVFGGPQDVEWAVGVDGHLWLLQSRPVTTEIRGVPVGPVYGPGPVAETFPEPLAELEHDLWVPPLRDAVREAVLLAGLTTPKEVAATEVIVSIGGHVAIDLRLAGEYVPKRSLLQKLNPVPGARRLRGAWQVGRLRAAMPTFAEQLLDRVDGDLGATPALSELTSRQLVGLFHRGHGVLRALHAHEILIGMLTDTGRNRMTGASVALRVLAEAREDGLTDEEVLERSPVVIALTAPRVGPRPHLPAEAHPMHLGLDSESGNDNGILREALRLRVRWVQELTGRAAWELGVRLTESGELVEPDMIRHMTLEHVEAVFTHRAVVIPGLVQTHLHNFGGPLPARFQISDRGQGHRRALRAGRRRGNRRRRRDRTGTGHLRRPGPADRERPGHHDAVPRARTAAHEAPRDRRRDRFRPVPPGDPRPRGRGAHRRRLRQRHPGSPRRRSGARRRRHRPGHRRDRSDRGGEPMKTIAWLAGIGTLVAGAVYMIVSLNRWEWNRALFFGLIVLIAEVGLATALILRKLGQLDRRPGADPATLATLRSTRPPSPDRFEWLKESARGERLNVFITFLVAGGVLLSGVAWVVDQLGSRTSTPIGEERLAEKLGLISYPDGGLVVDDVTVLAQDTPGADDAQIRKLLGRSGRGR